MIYFIKNQRFIYAAILFSLMLPTRIFAKWDLVHFKLPEPISPAKKIAHLKLTDKFLIAYCKGNNDKHYFVRFDFENKETVKSEVPYGSIRVLQQPILINNEGNGHIYFYDTTKGYNLCIAELDKEFNIKFGQCKIKRENKPLIAHTYNNLLCITKQSEKVQILTPEKTKEIDISDFYKFKSEHDMLNPITSWDGQNLALKQYRYFLVKPRKKPSKIIEVDFSTTFNNCWSKIICISNDGEKALFSIDAGYRRLKLMLYSGDKFTEVTMPDPGCYTSLDHNHRIVMVKDLNKFSPFLISNNREIFKFNFDEEQFHKICTIPVKFFETAPESYSFLLNPDYKDSHFFFLRDYFYSFKTGEWTYLPAKFKKIAQEKGSKIGINIVEKCCQVISDCKQPNCPALLFANSYEDNITDLLIGIYKEDTEEISNNNIIELNSEDR